MSAWTQGHELIFTLAVIVAISSWWIFMAVIVARLSGWHELAQRFARQGDVPCRQWSFRSARMKHSVNYNGCLTVGASPVGFQVAIMPLFQTGHPPLLIPWSEISYSRTTILFWPMVRFWLGRKNPVPFTVRKKLADDIQSAAGASWPAETRGS